jgi:hypothetical protein
MAKVEIGRIKNQEIGDWRLEIGDWSLAGKMKRGCGDLGWLRQEGMGRE